MITLLVSVCAVLLLVLLQVGILLLRKPADWLQESCAEYMELEYGNLTLDSSDPATLLEGE